MGVVASDEVLDEKETRFVQRVMDRFDVPRSEWDALHPLIDAQRAATQIAELPEADQETVFTLIAEASAADGKYVEEEVRYILEVAKHIGKSEADVIAALDDAIARVRA